MAFIIGVHGIGQQYKGANTLRSDWLPAIRDSLALVGAILPDDKAFVCATYGDLFRPRGTMSLEAPFDASDIESYEELELLDMLWCEAARTDPAVKGKHTKTMVRAPIWVQRALHALSNSSFFAGVAERALVFDLKQVSAYFADSTIRKACRARVEQVVTNDTRVLVGHSLGSVVAYEALCANPHWNVHTFITLGSPLGIRNLIFDRLEPSPVQGIGCWPASIKEWTNIADSGDIVALEKNLQACFGPRVLNIRVDNGAKAHDVTRYLISEEFGRALRAHL